MNTPISDIVNIRKTRFGLLRWTFAALLATCASTLSIQQHAGASPQDGLRIKNVASANSPSGDTDTPRLQIRNARVPIFVDVNLAANGGAPAVTEDAINQVIAAIDANPKRLITLRFKGVALRFNDLSPKTRETLVNKRSTSVERAYEAYMVVQISKLLDEVDRVRPGSPLTIQGLPFEGRIAESAAANAVFGRIIDRLSAIVVGGSVMVSRQSGGESSVLCRAFPAAVEAAGNRAILFPAIGGWRIATSMTDPVKQESATRLQRATAREEAEDSVGAATGDALALESQIIDDLAPLSGASTLDDPSENGSNSASSMSDGQGTSGLNLPSVSTPGLRGGLGAGGGGRPANSQPSEASGTDDEPWTSENEAMNGVDAVSNAAAGSYSDTGNESDSNPNGGGDSSESETNSNQDQSASGGDSESSQGDGSNDQTSTSEGAEEDAWDVVLEDWDGNRVLVPGAGFDEQPTFAPAVGDAAALGYDCKAIARWNVVPHQVVEAGFSVGIVAFHREGIRHVEFRLNGGPVTTVPIPTENPRSGTVEYWVEIPDGLAVGTHEIQACIVPNSGIPRVLAGPIDHSQRSKIGEHSMYLDITGGAPRVRYVSTSGSDDVGDGTPDNPMRTIEAALWDIAGRQNGGDIGDCEIRLFAGEYRLRQLGWPQGSMNVGLGWITICSAPGEEAADVRLMRSGTGIDGDDCARLYYMRRVRFKGLTLGLDPDWHPSNLKFLLWGTSNNSLWIDQCRIEGNFVMPDQAELIREWGWKYSTNSTAFNVWSGPFQGQLSRSNTIDGLLQDAYRDGLVIQAVVRNQDRELFDDWQSWDIHSDVWQAFNHGGVVENNIVFGLRAVDGINAQGFLMGDANLHSDFAAVDVRIENTCSGTKPGHLCLFMGCQYKNLVFERCSFTSAYLTYTAGSPWQQGNVRGEDVVFRTVTRIDVNTGEPGVELLFPFPDGPSPGWPGHWPGTIPWTSWDSGFEYYE